MTVNNKSKSNIRFYFGISVVTLLVAAVFFVYLIRIPVNNYSYDLASSNPDIGRVESDGYYFDMEHGDQLADKDMKIKLNIPQEVKKGSYTLRVGYRSNAGSYVGVMSEDDSWAVKCDRAVMTHLPEELPGEYRMNYGLGYLPGFLNAGMYVTKDVSDLDVYVSYCGFQTFCINSVELIGNKSFIKTIFPMFLAILLLIDLVVIVVRNAWINKEFKGIYRDVPVVLAIGLLSCIPLLMKEGLLFDDGQFIYGRINGIADGLRDGQFPVRIHPESLKGFGYGVSYFYPELFLYPFAALRLLGYSLRFCMYMLIAVMNIATALSSYYCTKRVFKNNCVACFCSFIYTFGLYRLVDVYERGAVAEALAIVFLPMVVAGMYVIIVGEQGSESGSVASVRGVSESGLCSDGVLLTAGLWGLINSHILSCEMVALFAVILCVVCFKRIFKKDCFVRLLKSVIAALLLSAYFIIPFLHMGTTDSFKVYAENAYETSANMLGFKDIMAFTVTNNPEILEAGGVRYSLGIVFMAAAVVMFVISVKQKGIRQFTTVCYIFGFMAIILTSSVFPWRAIESIGGVVRTVFCMVQFPWRYLSIATAMFMFAMGGTLAELNDKNRIIKVVEVSICLLLFVQACALFGSLKSTASENNLIYDGAGLGNSDLVGMGEYEPVGFYEGDKDRSIEELQYDINPGTSLNPIDGEPEGITIGPLSKSGTKYTILAINPTGQDQELYMPITYYEGYYVQNVNDTPNETGEVLTPVLYETDFGTVGLKIPTGYYNGIHIEYRENTLYRIAEVISLISIIVIAVCYYRRYGRTKRF